MVYGQFSHAMEPMRGGRFWRGKYDDASSARRIPAWLPAGDCLKFIYRMRDSADQIDFKLAHLASLDGCRPGEMVLMGSMAASLCARSAIGFVVRLLDGTLRVTKARMR